MLCTLSCALNPNRNPGRSQTDVEKIFKKFIGAKQVIWLSGEAIDGDDTDGHIDQLARFTDKATIVYAWSESDDPQHSRMSRNLEDLRSGLAQFDLNDVRLVALPTPPPIVLHERRIPASYCNFLIANGLVVVPQFGDPHSDEQALEILTPLFPERKVVGLNSVNLSVGLGSFHCLSQQQPEV